MTIYAPTTDAAIAAIREMGGVVNDPISIVKVGLTHMIGVVSDYRKLPKRSGSIRFKGNLEGVLWKRSCILATGGNDYDYLYRDANDRFYAEIRREAVKIDE